MKMLETMEFQYSAAEQAKIEELRQRVAAAGDLRIGTEDVLLSKFLNFGRWNVQRAYDSLRKYYDFKHDHPDWVARHPLEHFRDHFHGLQAKFVMPRPDRENRTIVVLKTVDAFDKYPDYIHDLVEMDDLLFESLLLLPNVQKYGITVIFDLSGTTRNFLRMLSPHVSRLVNAKTDVVPFAQRYVHLIQKGFLMTATSALVMRFMSKEIKERIFTHDGKNFDKLRNMVGYESLPAEYGGPSSNVLDVNFIYDHMQRNSAYLLQLQSYHKAVE